MSTGAPSTDEQMKGPDKEYYRAREIGRLQGRNAHLEATRDHYAALVHERDKVLHRQTALLKRYKRALKAIADRNVESRPDECNDDAMARMAKAALSPRERDDA
jgi:hypothetical protein